MDINQRKLQTTTTQSESMRMQDGEEPDLSLSSVGKTEKEFVVEDVENLKTIMAYYKHTASHYAFRRLAFSYTEVIY